jgi:hypothetical protein
MMRKLIDSPATFEAESASLMQQGMASSQLRTDCFAFLSDLTEICRRHGIGIAGDAVLFLMEAEDFPPQYAVDSESRLYRV